MTPAIKRLFKESFAPVLLVAMGIFLSLLYVEYKTSSNADAITVIRIDSTPLVSIRDDNEPADDDLVLAARENSDPRFQEAARLVAAGDWPGAEAKYREVIADKPSSQAYNDLGVLYLKKNAPQQALGYFDKALTTSPLYARAYYNRAITHTKLGNNKAAISDYTTLANKLPNYFDAHYKLGLMYIRTKNYQQAITSLERAKGLTGGEKKAMANLTLGAAYRELGNKEQARRSFETAIRLRPDYIEPRLELAAMEENTPEGRKQARAYYDEVFKLKPDYPPAYFSLARHYTVTGEVASAEEAYRNAIKFYPEYRKAHYNLGLLLLAQKRFSDAALEFEWVLKRDQNHSESHFNLARSSYGQKDYDSALKAYRKAIALRGGDYPEAYLNQGIVLAILKRQSEAEESYRKALKLKDAYPEAWYNLGILQLKQKQLPQAGDSFRTAIKHNPRYEQAWFNLGVLASREGKDDAAIDAYRHALQIRPDYPEARLNLAVRYAKQNRHKEAIAEYRALLDKDSSYASAWLNLGYAYLATESFEKAEHALRQSLSLEPHNIKSMKALAQSLSQQEKYKAAVEIMRTAVEADNADPKLRRLLARYLDKSGKSAEARVEYEKARRLDPENKNQSQNVSDNLQNPTEEQ